jgi:sulfite exporter TauE/SafE
MTLLAFLAARLKEPSSYAGIGALCAALGLHIDDAVLHAVMQLIVSAFALVAVLAPEKGAGGAP